MVRLDGIYHGQGNITYSGHSDHSFTMSILELTIDSSCHIAKGIWRENGMVDHFQGDLELVFSN
ncbi:hypothetical protein BrE312_3450 [Brenneria sp. EniD312]|nr:hypothetical protein BrE312_3450 [Brenneria sp. EniD312]PWC25836.1 hypothetical protein DDT54_00425 [Brenneria nigrifluens DSM 30175 = ATCC 13028]